MRVRVLPSITDPRSQLLVTFLVNDCVAIDAGALAFHLTGEKLLAVQDIVLTHVHLDHIASLPFIFSELFTSIQTPVRIHATAPDIERLRRHIFNDVIWPDFTRLRNAHGELLTFVPFAWRKPFEVAGLRMTAVPVTHTVETAGLIVEDGQSRCVAFTSDTGATDEFWEVLNALPRLDAVFVDVASQYPRGNSEGVVPSFASLTGGRASKVAAATAGFGSKPEALLPQPGSERNYGACACARRRSGTGCGVHVVASDEKTEPCPKSGGEGGGMS